MQSYISWIPNLSTLEFDSKVSTILCNSAALLSQTITSPRPVTLYTLGGLPLVPQTLFVLATRSPCQSNNSALLPNLIRMGWSLPDLAEV